MVFVHTRLLSNNTKSSVFESVRNRPGKGFLGTVTEGRTCQTLDKMSSHRSPEPDKIQSGKPLNCDLINVATFLLSSCISLYLCHSYTVKETCNQKATEQTRVSPSALVTCSLLSRMVDTEAVTHSRICSTLGR